MSVFSEEYARFSLLSFTGLQLVYVLFVEINPLDYLRC